MSADWVTISSLATAGGTLVLAVATFASIRSANRSARTAERALAINLRPVIMTSRMTDIEQKVGFADSKWFKVGGGMAVVEVTDDVIYFVVSIRNVGNGLGVLHGWRVFPDVIRTGYVAEADAPFHRLTRDLYIAPGDIGFFQGALREPGTDEFVSARRAIRDLPVFTLEFMYGDHEGNQLSVTRLAITRRGDEAIWYASTGRHWNLDGPNPR